MRLQRWSEKAAEAWKPNSPVEMGAKISFVPHAFGSGGPSLGDRSVPVTVTGRVTNINLFHRHYTVTYDIDGVEYRETFKF